MTFGDLAWYLLGSGAVGYVIGRAHEAKDWRQRGRYRSMKLSGGRWFDVAERSPTTTKRAPPRYPGGDGR